jgi:hypothetical protein
MRVEMELCNLSRDRLMGYLVEMGGQIIGQRAVTGPGWSAVLIELEPAQVGVIIVPRDRLIIDGDPTTVEQIHAMMRRRTMRGGG